MSRWEKSSRRVKAALITTIMLNEREAGASVTSSSVNLGVGMSSTSSAVPRTTSESTAAGAFVPRPVTATTATGAWWLYLITGVLWTFYGLFVLSMRPGSVASLAWFAGFAFIFAGISYFLTAGRVDSWRWLFYVGGVLGILAGLGAFAWRARPSTSSPCSSRGFWCSVASSRSSRRSWVRSGTGWWMGLLAGILQLILGVWAIGSPGRELLLLVNLVGIYMIFFGASEIFAAFAVRSARNAS
jgi:uncharacterized membrane protein HdeD (DUF308 family)